MTKKNHNGPKLEGAAAVACSDLLGHKVAPPSPLKEVLRDKIARLNERANALQALHDALPEITGELGAAISRELL